jgi:uncharacterized protein
MQVVKRPWGVAVRGMAKVIAEPDVARVRFRVGRAEKTPAQAFAAVTRAAESVHDAVRRQVPGEDVAFSRPGLRSQQGGYQSKPVGFRCEVAFAVECRDLDGVQQLLIDLVAAGVTDVDSLEFDVTTRDELHDTARRRAIAAARRTAELYAEAAGVSLGAVLHIEDLSADPAGDATGTYPAEPVAAVPGRLTVSAAVSLGFAIGGVPRD